MPHLPRSELEAILQSPCCRRALEGMTCSGCGAEFPLVNGKSVLIDFDSSIVDRESILASAGESAIPRRRYGVLQQLRALFGIRNEVAARNIAHLDRLLPAGSRILIVGGGTRGTSDRLSGRGDLGIVSFDIYMSPDVDLVADGHALPFVDGSFDLVIAEAVLEHVLTPQDVVDEIHRVLRPSGLVYAETPFLQNVHEGAYDFTRFTPSGHRWLFRKFDQIEAGPIGGPAAQLIWSAGHFAWGLTRRRAVGKIVQALLGPLQLLDRLIPERYRVDSAPGSYFLGRRSAVALPAGRMVAEYRGAQ